MKSTLMFASLLLLSGCSTTPAIPYASQAPPKHAPSATTQPNVRSFATPSHPAWFPAFETQQASRASPGPPPPSGTPPSQFPSGDYALSNLAHSALVVFGEDGAFSIDDFDQPLMEGVYSVEGDKITITGPWPGCAPSEGTYLWFTTDSRSPMLAFRYIFDACKDRAVSLSQFALDTIPDKTPTP